MTKRYNFRAARSNSSSSNNTVTDVDGNLASTINPTVSSNPPLPKVVNNPSLGNEISVRMFNGEASEVRASNWIYRFEMLAKRKNWSDSDKVFMLGNFLDEQASEWYITPLRMNEDIPYDDLKGLFLKRFHIELSPPLVECADLRYEPQKGFQHYSE